MNECLISRDEKLAWDSKSLQILDAEPSKLDCKINTSMGRNDSYL